MTIDGDGDDNCEFKRENRAAKESSPTAVESWETKEKSVQWIYTHIAHTLYAPNIRHCNGVALTIFIHYLCGVHYACVGI